MWKKPLSRFMGLASWSRRKECCMKTEEWICARIKFVLCCAVRVPVMTSMIKMGLTSSTGLLVRQIPRSL